MNDGIYSAGIILIGLGELGLTLWMFKSGNIKDCLRALEKRLGAKIDEVKTDLSSKMEDYHKEHKTLEGRFYKHVTGKDGEE